jgi:hypothetical protein
MHSVLQSQISRTLIDSEIEAVTPAERRSWPGGIPCRTALGALEQHDDGFAGVSACHAQGLRHDAITEQWTTIYLPSILVLNGNLSFDRRICDRAGMRLRSLSVELPLVRDVPANCFNDKKRGRQACRPTRSGTENNPIFHSRQDTRRAGPRLAGLRRKLQCSANGQVASCGHTQKDALISRQPTAHTFVSSRLGFDTLVPGAIHL